MRIITVNLPVTFLKAIDSLTGNKGLYPSRSELIRVAVRAFLLREIEAGQSFQTFAQKQAKIAESEYDNKIFVRVPSETKEGEYTQYRLKKKGGVKRG